MSVRQYIGARYVPRFSDVNDGNWSSSYAYEPLIIVKNGNDYYTSKQRVPVGIAITNTNYWVKTGDYNGAISNLQDQINDINSDIKPLVIGPKVVIAGDSYGVVDGSWVPEFTSRLHNLYPNATVINKCIGGKAASNSSYNDCISAMSVDNDVTAVILCGGYNEGEGTPESQIITGLISFFTLAKTKFPNAQFSLGFIGNNRLATSAGASKRLYLATTALPAYKAMERNGIRYLNGVENIMHSTDFFVSDKVHPNSTGGVALGDGIFDAFMYGICDFKLPASMFNITYDSSINPAGNEIAASSTLINDQVSINFNKRWRCIFASATTVQYNELLPIGTFDNKYVLPSAADLTALPCHIIAYNGSSRQYVNGYILLSSTGEIGIQLYGNDSIPGVTSLFIIIDSIMCPTMYC